MFGSVELRRQRKASVRPRDITIFLRTLLSVPSVRHERKGTHMPLNFAIDDTCPTCGSTIRYAFIDRHPTNRDAAIHSLKCTDCGYKKTRVLSLRPTA
jgi:predicted RNA-binding Zn-ribbon protein involved in translation (DUF1610 family)